MFEVLFFVEHNLIMQVKNMKHVFNFEINIFI